MILIRSCAYIESRTRSISEAGVEAEQQDRLDQLFFRSLVVGLERGTKMIAERNPPSDRNAIGPSNALMTVRWKTNGARAKPGVDHVASKEILREGPPLVSNPTPDAHLLSSS